MRCGPRAERGFTVNRSSASIRSIL
jgi:hypothetical protein